MQQTESSPLLSKELKKLRLRISDYNKSPVLDAVCLKMWRLMLCIQYEETLMELVDLPSSLPLDLDVYQSMLPLFQKALGIYFFSDYYVARSDTFKGKKVYLQRFIYDLISMFGLHLFYIELNTLEMLLRRVYRAITYSENGKVYLRRIQDVNVAFTDDEFEQAIEIQNREDNKRTAVQLEVQKSPALASS